MLTSLENIFDPKGSAAVFAISGTFNALQCRPKEERATKLALKDESNRLNVVGQVTLVGSKSLPPFLGI